jgi:hypothetical protein
MNRAPLLVFLVALVPACDEGSPASPTYEGVEAGQEQEASYAVCPTGMTATFDSIYSLMLSNGSTQLDGQQSCGANVAGNCHSTSGSGLNGNDSLLDYSLDAGAVYAELLKPSSNIGDPSNPGADFHPLRVAPYDAGASMLYIKITLDTSSSPLYGSGMPYTAPGSVCPAAVQAVEDWINQGAPGPGAVTDAGADGPGDAHKDDAPSDATLDGTTDATSD